MPTLATRARQLMAENKRRTAPPPAPPPAPLGTDFLLRKVDSGLWSQFRARATQDGHTARWVLLTLIADYVRHGLPQRQGDTRG